MSSTAQHQHLLSQTSCSTHRSTTSTNTSLSSTNTRRSTNKKAKIVGAADKNIFALQDAGNTKWIDEHTHYLASSITEQSNSCVDTTTRASSALELAQLVGGDEFSSASRSGNYNALRVLLDAVAVGLFLNPSFLERTFDDDCSSTYSEMIRNEIMYDDNGNENGNHNRRGAKKKRGLTTKHTAPNHNVDTTSTNNWNDATALALAAVAYFVSLEDAKLFWGHSDAIASLARLLRWDDDTTSTSTAASTIASTLTHHPHYNNSTKGNHKRSTKNHHHKRKKRQFNHASLQNENINNNKKDDDFDFLEDEARDKVPPLPPSKVIIKTTDPTKRGRRKRQRRMNHQELEKEAEAEENEEEYGARPSSAGTALSSATASTTTSSYNTSMSMSTSNSNSSNNLNFDDDSMNTNNLNKKKKKKLANSSSDRARQKQIDQVIALVRKREAQLSKEEQAQQYQQQAATPPPVQSALRVPDDITVSWLALKALQTVIIAANDHHDDDDDEGDEHSPTIIINRPTSSSSTISQQRPQQSNENSKKKKKDPMFINNLLRESDSLPHLALALRASCDRAITTYSNVATVASSRSIGFLQDRIIMLTSMIDTVCCLTPDNRTVLCQGTGLVDYMVRLVAVCCLSPAASSVACSDDLDANEDRSSSSSGVPPQKHTEELILSCLKAITSLTHENRLAGESLCKERSWCDRYINIVASSSESSKSDCGGTSSVRTARSCIGIIFRVLEQMIRKNCGDGIKNAKDKSKPQKQHQLDQKVIYDVRIFCLSILTNAAETGKSARRELAKCTVRVCADGEEGTSSVEQRPAIQWLASWIVDQTCAFRSSLVALSSSRSNQINGEEEKKRDDEGDLAAGEEESLNTTGNGFLLLACLLKRWKDCSDEAPVREMILDEMPQVEGSSKRVQYIIAGLNAFLNFYHVSLDGALSDAIVTPVVKLIDELKQL